MTFEYKKTITTPNLEKELNLISESIEKLNLPKGFFEFVVYVISELFTNIKEHAHTDRAFVVFKINKQKCLIDIIDKGVGLKQSYLSKQIYVKDDFAAIEFAFSGLSTKGLQERGFGLYSVRKFAEELDGEMIIESGLAKAVIQKNKINFQKLKKEIQGVNIKINTPIEKIDFYKIIT
ncbi:MAG: ATP-binding protein [bacterium]